MNKFIKEHPAFTQADAIADICRPLEKLNITYFSHVHINRNREFFALANNPLFGEHYLKNKYYNADIHLANVSDLGKYIIWDALPKCGETEKMDRESLAFGIRHTFTIVDQNEKGSHFYHYATDLKGEGINQVYLSNLDLLKKFIIYFNEKVHKSKLLSVAYHDKFSLDLKPIGFSMHENNELEDLKEKRIHFNEQLNMNSMDLPKQVILNNDTLNPLYLAPQQMRCLILLLSGKSSKEIGLKLGLSHRSVEHYIQNIRKILGCKNSKELMTSYTITNID